MLGRKFTKLRGQMVTGPKVEMSEEGGVPMCERGAGKKIMS